VAAKKPLLEEMQENRKENRQFLWIKETYIDTATKVLEGWSSSTYEDQCQYSLASNQQVYIGATAIAICVTQCSQLIKTPEGTHH